MFDPKPATAMKKRLSEKSPLSVVVVGQTPPPYHGQSIMIQMLLDGKMKGVQLHHVRMAFSDDLDQVGRFQVGKLVHLFGLIVRIVIARFRYRASILYYPPAGPNKVPLLRDFAILTATRWLFAKTVYHFQASGCSEKIESFPKLLRGLVRWSLARPTASIQLSPFAVDDAEYLDSTTVFTIPNASYDEATKLGWTTESLNSHRTCDPSKRVRVLYVGTVCESKGVLILLDACRLLANSEQKFHLDVVGGFQPADFQGRVQERIRELGMESYVKIHGQKTGDAKWSMFAEADLFCFPSHYESEGFPCVLVEAMCFALPIVSTRWRGIPSIVDEGTTGFLCEIRSPESVAANLAKLVESSELRRRMGNHARARYEADLTQEKHIENVRQVFLSL